MLSFLTSRVRDAADPLASVKAVMAWERGLPERDVIARAELALTALERSRQSRAPVDAARARGLLHVDRLVRGDCRKVLRGYLESVDAAAATVSTRLWHLAFDVAQAFIGGYRLALDAALETQAVDAWKPYLPLLLTRLTHQLGIDAKLRIFRHEAWIPAKWQELHRVYACACELGVARVPASLDPSGTGHRTVEQEYLAALLLHRANAGNLSPNQFEWVAGKIRSCCGNLELTAHPAIDADLCVDIGGRTGLVECTGQESGTLFRYLDTAPLAAQLDTGTALLDAAEVKRPAAGAAARERAGVLHDAYAVISPARATQQRRDPREACSVAARVHLGLARIHQLRRANGAAAIDAPEGNSVLVQLPTSREARRPATRSGNTVGATLSLADHTSWQVSNRSTSGLCILARGAAADTLALGEIAAIRQSDLPLWRLGVVRRMKRLTDNHVEFGVELIAERFEAFRLYPADLSDPAAGVSVVGFDTAMPGQGIPVLYLPPSRPEQRAVAKSVILPIEEYTPGRQMLLASRRSIYTVALRQAIERHSQWCWAVLKVVARQSRESAA